MRFRRMDEKVRDLSVHRSQLDRLQDRRIIILRLVDPR
jgi:hypothetical protein